MRHGLAVIAVRLAMQLVEHVCHCDYASVGVAQRTQVMREEYNS
jgi:hypothetical protein